ncbi:MAG: OmpA family protein [Rhodobacteraceae bacterium]|nr:OmpA family protein [Paracoccaceae bacterium]
MARKPIPLPQPVYVEEEPKKCPPRGAPAWMATFADIAILLMAFFVLILSFAEFNHPKFKQVAGSLRQAFGIQRDVPVLEQPKGTTILELNFSPSPDIAITEEIIQDTTDTSQPEIVEAAESEEEGTGEEGDRDSDEEALGQGASEVAREIAVLADALEAAISARRFTQEVRVTAEDETLVVDFGEVPEDELPERLIDAARALASAETEEIAPELDVVLRGLDRQLDRLAEAALAQDRAAAEDAASRRNAAIAAAELTVALRREISEGLVSVETREDKVVVTVGAGGSFPSGRAELTDQAREIMSRIAVNAMDDASDIVVTGHTDSIPISGSSQFRDNWGLAAARASAVVRELEDGRGVAPGRMSALSRGETVPVADNATAQGRARNRRIEIEFQY